MRSTPKKTCEQIIASGNHYLGALKGNHGNFFKAIESNFQSEAHIHSVETGHGRVERRTVSLCRNLDLFPQASPVVRIKDYHQGHQLSTYSQRPVPIDQRTRYPLLHQLFGRIG